ncbi:pspE [Symbiodinium sp. CCMP2592]|nr:pspE [Symbiodinium sp. CCMP2592]
MVPLTFVPAASTPALRSPGAHPVRVVRHARGGEGEGDVVEQLLKPGVVLLDVRTEEEYMDGHVPGSVNIPHTEIKYRKNQLPPDTDTPMVVFCARGIRAQMAQDVLQSLGYTDVVNGMTWQAVQDTRQVLICISVMVSHAVVELSSNDFITRLAEQQAGRDVEMKNQQRQVQQLNQSLAEVQKMLQMSYAQEKVLKDRIRELESSQGRTHVAGDYLKHVVLKYIEYCQKGDLKSQSLVPVLCTLLNLSPAERRLVEHSSVPSPLLHINQVAGAAGAWLWSGEKLPETEPEGLG